MFRTECLLHFQGSRCRIVSAEWDTKTERPRKGPLFFCANRTARPGGLDRYAASRSAFTCITIELAAPALAGNLTTTFEVLDRRCLRYTCRARVLMMKCCNPSSVIHGANRAQSGSLWLAPIRPTAA